MWFGTEDGLDKYDGYSFTIFRNDLTDKNSLSNNYINCISPADSEGNVLLIGTINGLNELDLRTGIITQRFKAKNDSNPRLNEIHCIYKDSKQNIWIGTGDGVRIYNITEGTFIYPVNERPFLKLIEDKIVYSISEDSFGDLWIDAENGLLRINKNRKNYHFFKNKLTNLTGTVNFLFEDSLHYLWFMTSRTGICRLKSGSADNFVSLKNELSKNRTIDYANVHAFLEDKDGSIWLGSVGEGLHHLKYTGSKLTKITNYKHIDGQDNGLSSNIVMSLYQDHSGIIWAGTSAGGLNKIIEDKINFKIYRASLSDRNTLFDNSVWSFYENRIGNDDFLWVGTNKGLARLNRQTGNFTNFPEPDFNKDKTAFPVRGIIENKQNTLLLATLGGGPIEFNETNTKYKLDDENTEKKFSIKENLVYCINYNGNDIAWIGTNSEGLMKFNLKSGKYTHVNFVPPNKELYTSWVMTICNTDSNYIWFGTWKLGLVKYNYKTGRYLQYRNDPNKKNSINSDIILSIFKGKNDILWIGTYGGGLNKFNLKKNQFSFYTEKNGLSNNVVYGILSDAFGNLWMSTNKGISKFNPRKETFSNYDVNDGLQGNEFNLGAYYKTKDGELFFGGDNGFNGFYPNALINNIPPQIVFTSFTKNGTKINYKGSLNSIKHIDLPYDENNFSIEFVALHYKDPSKNKYAYRLKGVDKKWVYAGNRRNVNYTNLKPGNYEFYLKASNSDGVWSEKPVKLSIIISSPYWQKLWFVLGITTVIVLGIFFYGRNLAFRRLKLERIKVEERETLRKKIAADFHDELGSRVTKINLMSKLLEKELFDKTKAATDYIVKITENAEGLYNEMREFIWELNPERDSLSDLASQLKSFSEQLFDKTDVAFQIKGLKDEYEKIKLPMDWRQHLLRIFKEGMNNILKHAEGCRNVCLEITFRDNLLTIILADDGIGFNKNGNTLGNGLNNMHERAQKLNGSLKIQSGNGDGSKIIFSGKLP